MPAPHREKTDDVVFVGACRTPIGRYGGSLKDLSARDLGVPCVEHLLASTGLPPERVDRLIFGNGRQAGGGPNVARQIALSGGLPESVPAWTLNMACGSGLKSVIDAAHDIQRGEADIVIAGGTESMSRLPYFLEQARWGQKLGSMEVVDAMYRDGFFCPLAKMVMGETVEWLAGEYGITRESQDRYAAQSQERAAAAASEGRFDAELVSMTAHGKVILARDEHPRPDSTFPSLSRLKPVFGEEGTITAGNASGITDGAAAVLMMRRSVALDLGLKILAVYEESATAAVAPRSMGIGPVPATRALLERTGTRLEEYDLIEVNEAFAAQVLAVLADMPMEPDRLNVNGGSIALGHPIGATGCRILVTLIHEMRRREVTRGLATLCISGGQGLAVSVSARDEDVS